MIKTVRNAPRSNTEKVGMKRGILTNGRGAGGTGKEKGPVRESDDLAQYMEHSLAIALPYRDQEAFSPPAKAANDRKRN
jgi:hypothetical protein